MFNFDFKKSLGQNFLTDDNIINKIVDSIDYKDNSLIIEIGPGAGALSKRLINRTKYLLLYEIDTRLEKILSKELEGHSNYDVIFDDFLKRDVNLDIKKYDCDNLYIVANLPYYITTPIITKIIEDNIKASEITIMIQKEVADRLSAKPGNKEYGYITVFLNYFYDINRITNVSKNCFIPKPKVDSAVIKLTKKDPIIKANDINHFNKLVKDSFRFKRKTIRNNLNNYDMDVVKRVLNEYNFTLDTRSENVPYDVFVKLSNELLNK